MPATILLRREPGPHARSRDYRVLLDGAPAGSIREGETRELRVESGDHRIQLRIDWMGSPPIVVRAEDDTVVRVVCRSSSASILKSLLWRWSDVDIALEASQSLPVVPRLLTPMAAGFLLATLGGAVIVALAAVRASAAVAVGIGTAVMLGGFFLLRVGTLGLGERRPG